MDDVVMVEVVKLTSLGYVKCPRCWKSHPCKENFDQLCDRCCQVLLESFPTHEAIPFIRHAYHQQALHYG